VWVQWGFGARAFSGLAGWGIAGSILTKKAAGDYPGSPSFS